MLYTCSRGVRLKEFRILMNTGPILGLFTQFDGAGQELNHY